MNHHILPGSNTARVELVNGEKVVIPFYCACGEQSCYGDGNDWFCTTCWQEKVCEQKTNT